MPNRRKQTDQEFLMALACGATVETAALKARISERTAYRRLQDPVFCKQLDAKKREIVQRSATMLNAVSLEAVKVLAELQQGINPPAVRLGATRAAIYLAMKLRENLELTERMTALETRLETLLEDGGEGPRGTQPPR
jgi:hypothetical protein